MTLPSLACLTPTFFWCLVTGIVSVILAGNKRWSLSVQGGSLFNKMFGGGSRRPTKETHETEGVSQNIQTPIPNGVKKEQQTPISNGEAGQQTPVSSEGASCQHQSRIITRKARSKSVLIVQASE